MDSVVRLLLLTSVVLTDAALKLRIEPLSACPPAPTGDEWIEAKRGIGNNCKKKLQEGDARYGSSAETPEAYVGKCIKYRYDERKLTMRRMDAEQCLAKAGQCAEGDLPCFSPMTKVHEYFQSQLSDLDQQQRDWARAMDERLKYIKDRPDYLQQLESFRTTLDITLLIGGKNRVEKRVNAGIAETSGEKGAVARACPSDLADIDNPDIKPVDCPAPVHIEDCKTCSQDSEQALAKCIYHNFEKLKRKNELLKYSKCSQIAMRCLTSTRDSVEPECFSEFNEYADDFDQDMKKLDQQQRSLMYKFQVRFASMVREQAFESKMNSITDSLNLDLLQAALTDYKPSGKDEIFANLKKALVGKGSVNLA